jgi:hypothetical protein
MIHIVHFDIFDFTACFNSGQLVLFYVVFPPSPTS